MPEVKELLPFLIPLIIAEFALLVPQHTSSSLSKTRISVCIGLIPGRRHYQQHLHQ